MFSRWKLSRGKARDGETIIDGNSAAREPLFPAGERQADVENSYWEISMGDRLRRSSILVKMDLCLKPL